MPMHPKDKALIAELNKRIAGIQNETEHNYGDVRSMEIFLDVDVARQLKDFAILRASDVLSMEDVEAMELLQKRFRTAVCAVLTRLLPGVTFPEMRLSVELFLRGQGGVGMVAVLFGSRGAHRLSEAIQRLEWSGV